MLNILYLMAFNNLYQKWIYTCHDNIDTINIVEPPNSSYSIKGRSITLEQWVLIWLPSLHVLHLPIKVPIDAPIVGKNMVQNGY